MELEAYLLNKNVLEGIQAKRIQPKDQIWAGGGGVGGKGYKSKQIDFFPLLLTLFIEIVRK